MILLIDNYDSFVFNLEQQMGALGAEVRVVRNDALSVVEALGLGATAVAISPGPGRPLSAGIVPELICALPDEIPLLGICLGHQALIESEGGCLEVDADPLHGKSSLVHHDGTGPFDGLASPITCGRYHSLRAARESVPESLRVTAWTEDGAVMAVEHVSLPRFGFQFHPESILTPLGDKLIARFLSLSGEAVSLDGRASGVLR